MLTVSVTQRLYSENCNTDRGYTVLVVTQTGVAC